MQLLRRTWDPPPQLRLHDDHSDQPDQATRDTEEPTWTHEGTRLETWRHQCGNVEDIKHKNSSDQPDQPPVGGTVVNKETTLPTRRTYQLYCTESPAGVPLLLRDRFYALSRSRVYTMFQKKKPVFYYKLRRIAINYTKFFGKRSWKNTNLKQYLENLMPKERPGGSSANLARSTIVVNACTNQSEAV